MNVRLALCAALLLPAAGFAANPARHELSQVLAAKPDFAHGAELFRQCVACHGSDGGGNINGSTPRLAGQHFRVLAKQLVDFRYGYRWDFRMEQLANKHHLVDAQDLADVAAFVSRMDIPEARGVGDGNNLPRGAALYAERCQSCHGANAEGDDAREVPRLAGQHSAYLMRQIYDAVDGRRPPLSRTHTQKLAALEFEDVLALTDYLARIGAKDAAAAPSPPPPPTQFPPTH